MANPLTEDDVKQRTRDVFEIWNTMDPDAIVALYTGGSGFGYRTRPSRPPAPSKEAYRQGLLFWRTSLVSYSIYLDEVHALAEGNVGVAWGFYREEFQEVGKEPTKLTGRFSEVMVRDADGWRTLHYHRDMTPFDEKDQYIPVSP